VTTTDTTPAGGQVLDLLPATIRLWARSNDLDVAPSGRIPETIVDAYRKAHGHAPTPRPKPAPPARTIATPKAPQPAGTAEVAQLRRELRTTSEALTESQHDAETVRAVLLTAEEQRDQARVEANKLAVELAETRQVGDRNHQAVVVATLPGPLPGEILELLAAWHALFAKATEVDTAAGHTLAEVALPALVSETADQIHDLVRLLDGDTTR
jgi:hypothetical protein